ncbi:DNA polymerase III subunit alpha [Sandaracinobacter neustonicus]|uniref:Error-prone DNA polymerase n=1 Tax=Sandaracinobacter neustonicus TaxID=1715348 RepID=A0A501XJQ7_9SPHN|nr:error-prone DNA polymerase [Sandaracinobacter neustonicus]TPE60504.1 DNA polymerase III subunit alpha [Sandaracinobacter neustonicus]
MTGFAELAAATNYSFLRGASHPHEMVAKAMALGMAGIGIADRNTVAGVVRAHVALREATNKAVEDGLELPPFRLVVGARLVFTDGTPDIIAYPQDRHGWGQLTRLLSTGNRRATKGDCDLYLDDLLAHGEGLLLIAFASEADAAALRRLREVFPRRLWLAATMPRRGDDLRRLERLRQLGRELLIPLIASNDALYAVPQDRPLHDVLTCIREKVTIHTAGRRLEANAERHLKSPVEMARLFHACPEAVAESLNLFARIRFSLDQLSYEYPHEPVPQGWEPLGWLKHLVLDAARDRYGAVLPKGVQARLAEEFDLIERRNYACYFLTVHDLVRYARAQEPPILCQGRGSAANSIVCFLLGVTSVDPEKYDLLFSRFVSEDRAEPPDIDVDFEHERREEVMQYVYRRYGRERAGIAATVIHYRPRSALRDVGKVLGFSEDVTSRLSSTVWGSFAGSMEEKRYAEAGVDPANPEIARLAKLVNRLIHFPRHLSQHVGGFVLTEDRLDETVPIHNAAMEERTFIEWDKDDIDALNLMKVDVLALGMLTCIRKSFELMRAHDLGDHDLELDGTTEDAAVYDMLCKGDSIGVFQVESRAQINMLPRLKPRTLYDLTIQVAIVRPGPIEGDMVHPYLRRRSGVEKVDYPSPGPPHDPNELKGLLGKTFGVPLFQEQAMKLAIVAAGFTPGEANQLRKAMATFRNVGTIHEFEPKMIEGMVARGYERAFAQRCYDQIKGFGSYGFPESHALAFAKLVYVSAWIKCHQPAVFACALLNSQPMGFYAPAQIVRDAREHGVEVRHMDVNASEWDNSLERDANGAPALRLGFCQIDGFREEWADALAGERQHGDFTGIEELARRAHLPSRALHLLADADAFQSLALPRREALWQTRRTPTGELPLFAAASARELGEEADMALPAMPESEEVVADYQMIRLSLRRHPMSFLRDELRVRGILSSAEAASAEPGRRVQVAGVVLIRQRPGKGNAIFVTLEDETGVMNLLIWARTFERMRRPVMSARLMRAEGVLQRSPEGVIHLMTDRVEDLTHMLGQLEESHANPTPPDRARHPRNVRVLPNSRDFH